MSDAPRRLPPSFKGVASGRTGMRGAARFISWRTRSRETGAESGSAGLVGTPPDPDSVGEIAERGEAARPALEGRDAA